MPEVNSETTSLRNPATAAQLNRVALRPSQEHAGRAPNSVIYTLRRNAVRKLRGKVPPAYNMVPARLAARCTLDPVACRPDPGETHSGRIARTEFKYY